MRTLQESLQIIVDYLNENLAGFQNAKYDKFTFHGDTIQGWRYLPNTVYVVRAVPWIPNNFTLDSISFCTELARIFYEDYLLKKHWAYAPEKKNGVDLLMEWILLPEEPRADAIAQSITDLKKT